jgi:hypothetical protein
MEEKVTIEPPPAFFINGITARAQLNVPFTFTSKTPKPQNPKTPWG